MFEFTKPLTIFCGDNGSGKTTILQAVVDLCGFNRSGGTGSHLYGSNATGSIAAWKGSWRPKVTNGFYLRPDSLSSFSSFVDDLAKEHGRSALRPYGGKSLAEQSHGEAYLSLVINRFQGRGVYVLDEPEVALSPDNQLALITRLMDMAATGEQQIILATHSPLVMAIPEADLHMISGSEIVKTGFRDTPHFRTLKRFYDDPDRLIASLG